MLSYYFAKLFIKVNLPFYGYFVSIMILVWAPIC